jgi:hypothetical protein
VSKDASRIGKLILVPAVTTLAVTLLRLIGGLQGWSPILFNRGDKAWSPALVGIIVAFAIVGLATGILAWPSLGRTLLAYGLAARISVALLMLVAMLGNWGTHYDARPSYPPQMSTLAWWVTLGLVPQLFFWIWYTIGFGALFGIVAAAIARRRGTAAG